MINTFRFVSETQTFVFEDDKGYLIRFKTNKTREEGTVPLIDIRDNFEHFRLLYPNQYYLGRFNDVWTSVIHARLLDVWSEGLAVKEYGLLPEIGSLVYGVPDSDRWYPGGFFRFPPPRT